VLAANTSMRGVEVKHVRRRDVDLEKVWDVESVTGKGVLYVGHSKNETSKHPPNLYTSFGQAIRAIHECRTPRRQLPLSSRGPTAALTASRSATTRLTGAV
jgi:hypothetical protein